MATPFSPLTLRSVTARNRIWIAPMCQYAVERQDGVPTAWHAVHLGQFAIGGAGIVMAEATAVSPEGRITPRDTGIWNDQQAAAWAPIAAFITSQGAVPAIQLAHAGRKASTQPPWSTDKTGTVPVAEGGWETLAPSAIAFTGYDAPTEMSLAQIAAVVRDFGAAARRAVDAGFRVIEVHAAHGYLLHSFLSPLSNTRTDSFGGSPENRAKLLELVIREVRTRIGDLPLFVRLSATDWAEGGLDTELITDIGRRAAEAGADLLDVSTGGLVAEQSIPVAPLYQVPFAETLRKATGIPVAAVGLFTTPEQVGETLEAEQADAILIGREALRDPHFPLRAAHALGAEIDYVPGPYARAPFGSR
ncbi:NADH:flavin oxidoreductase/NADH oxidase [Mycetocola tolaasinivorans]|uniref:NADH:flavin oxidoreductase/NADH oxidase n=1 Tax=Mycetocola tolaasinivorans TaxID=76635 RepID=A0A3L7A8A2_9MICO|nr:NADH:flavin oxidoreductase/NADH oxidase [Mycetocola tolaasinivorans]RLP76088.1 NADH:flavin oxidoreductase/NADH oxidase [Mycetocola tolaasinivorans]